MSALAFVDANNEPFRLTPSTRIRRSPFYQATVAAGAKSFTVYNHMLMPTGYGDPDAEYWRLLNAVSMWDVAVERQIELKGPDAMRLAQLLVPRKLDRLRPGVGWYVPVCDHRGTLINDPILLKLSEERCWFSIADGDLASFARTVGAERGLDVQVTEPDVSPLAIQGPFAEDVAACLFGNEVRDIKHFHFRDLDLDGIRVKVARSGWSKQGGFELYLQDSALGTELWNRVALAGASYGIGPGTPNPSERIESGLLSWGGDTDDMTNPFEVRMSRFVDLDAPDDVLSIRALRDIHAQGPKRHQLGVLLGDDAPYPITDLWYTVESGTTTLGVVTATAWSPRIGRNIGLALVSRAAGPGHRVEVTLPDGRRIDGQLCELPFL